jgi:deazaflavin-dependent oxidoreductase (nitroreductase family)
MAQEEIVDSPTKWVNKHIRSYMQGDGFLYMGIPTLLLTTRGRRSGQLRRTALMFGEDAGRYLLVASNGGSATDPAWYLNLTADPSVTVQVRDEVFAATARTAMPREKPALWEIMVGVFGQYARYQAQTDREIPLIILERTP